MGPWLGFVGVASRGWGRGERRSVEGEGDGGGPGAEGVCGGVETALGVGRVQAGEDGGEDGAYYGLFAAGRERGARE